MRVSLPRATVGRIFRYAQFVVFAAALSILSYCAYVEVDAWVFEKNQSQRLDEILRPRNAIVTRGTAPISPAPRVDGLVGRLEIERLGISVMVVEGTSGAVLRRAAGHIAGTPLPGEMGNIGISAHRDTFFRPLRNVRENDLVTVTTPAGHYRYMVVSTKIVEPDDVGVLSGSGSEVLTLVTCYPFYFIGAAPRRFIVRAKRING
jgi:sortase A